MTNSEHYQNMMLEALPELEPEQQMVTLGLLVINLACLGEISPERFAQVLDACLIESHRDEFYL